MKTIRRDRLLRLARNGKLVLVRSYHFDDQHGEDRAKKEMPVEIRPDDPDWWKYRKEGVCYLRPDEFTGNSGNAYQNEDGTIVHLRVHSNSNYDFRVLP